MTDKEFLKAYDILVKFVLFNQREGRELWNDKPKDIQDKDVINREIDIKFLKDYITRQHKENKFLELMNREKTDEIRDLRVKNKALKMEKEQLESDICNSLMNADHMTELYNNAIKEFAEILKKEVSGIPQCHFNLLDVEHKIDKIANKMTGGEK